MPRANGDIKLHIPATMLVDSFSRHCNPQPTMFSKFQRNISDIVLRNADRQRQLAVWQRDPLQFDPNVEYEGPELGLHPMFETGADEETLRWLASRAYSHQAHKQLPIDLCHEAMALYHGAWLRNDDVLTHAFLATARRLYDRAEWRTLERGTCLVMPHLEPLEGYDEHELGWPSSMVQGWMLSIFMRAHQLVPDAGWLDAARLALRIFDVDVAKGGLRHEPEPGWVVFEMYPIAGQCRQVLNGFLSSLFGLHEMARAAQDANALRLFEQGLATLLHPEFLPSYDTGHISLYDLASPRTATPSCVFYTWVHARQLAALSLITGEPNLMEWALRFRQYGRDARHRMRSNLECSVYRVMHLPHYLGRAINPQP